MHCGTRILDGDRKKAVHRDNGDRFCCWGCETVYEILKRESFSLINSPNSHSSEYEFLDNESFFKDYLLTVDGKEGMRFFVEGVQCTACLWIIDQIPKWVPQVESVHLNMSQKTLFVSLEEAGYFGKVASILAALGYRVIPIKSLDEARHFQKREVHQQLRRLGIAAACTGNIMLFSLALYSGLKGQMAIVFEYLSLVFFGPILLYCAQPFYLGLWRSLKAGRPSIDLPIVIAVIIGFVLSLYNLIRGIDEYYFDSLSLLIFLLLASRYLLNRTQQAFISRSYLQSFIESQVCKRWNSDKLVYENIPARLLKVGDKILLHERERIPADGIVVNDYVNVNPSLLTGESTPQKLFQGAEIYAGTEVVTDSAEVLVKRTAGDSRIGQILNKVEEQIDNTTPLVSLTDRASHYFSISTLLVGTIFFFFYYRIDSGEAVRRSLALIILACPCALAFATPLTQSLSLRKASIKGYLIKSAESFERLSSIKNAFFDKTGTLTQGNFEFLRWGSPRLEDANNFSPDQETRNAIYSIELNSPHPIARALVSYLEKSKIERLPVLSLKEIPGSGISGIVDEKEYKIVSVTPDEYICDDSEIISSGTAIYRDDVVVAFAYLGDMLYSDSRRTIDCLKEMGIKPYILSGDKSVPVSRVAEKLNLENEQIKSDLVPEEKNNIIQKYPQSVMVGDGVNDSLAMSSDAISIAVQGSAEESLVAADIYVTKGGLFPVMDLILLSKNTFTVIKRNLVFSFVYNVSGGLAALLGYISPLTAAILMPISSITVVLSSLIGTKFLRNFVGSSS